MSISSILDNTVTSNYIVTLSANTKDNGLVNISGYLMDDSIGFSASASLGITAAGKAMQFAKGMAEGVGGAIGTTLVNSLSENYTSVAEGAKIFESSSLGDLQFNLFIEMTDKNYNQIVENLYCLILPTMVGDTTATADSLKIPLMKSNLLVDATSAMKAIDYKYFDDKLISLTIGKWFLSKGGWWLVNLATPVVKFVNINGKPIRFASIQLTFNHHRPVTASEFSKWFIH